MSVRHFFLMRVLHNKSILTAYRDGSLYAFYIARCVFLHGFFYRDELYSWWFLERLSLCFIILFVLCIWSSTFCKFLTWQKPVIIDLPWKGCKTWDKGNAARNIFYIYCLLFDKDSKRAMVTGMKLESTILFRTYIFYDL